MSTSALQSAEDLRREANELMVEEEYAAALEKYTEAIEMDGDNARCYLPRAACHMKLNNYKDALSDSTEAVRLQPKSATAFYRLGLSNFHLENFRAAQTALTKARELGNKRCDLWLRKCEAEIEDEDEDVVMPQAPVATSTVVEEKQQAGPPPPSSSSSSLSSSSSSVAAPKPAIKKKPIKMQFIQRGPIVQCAIYARKAKVLDVAYTEDSFSVRLHLPWGEEWEASLDTYDRIVPDECSYTRNDFKVIVSLKKADETKAWKSLEKLNESDPNVQQRENLATNVGEVPSYPSSNKKKIDWDGVDKEVAEEIEKEKLEGDQALNKLFSDLYSKGDEDTRRAMIKSMQTSGGTCLSTNWKDVEHTDYESSIQAPEGSEVQRFEV